MCGSGSYEEGRIGAGGDDSSTMGIVASINNGGNRRPTINKAINNQQL
jgi:hypothetical protein